MCTLFNIYIYIYNYIYLLHSFFLLLPPIWRGTPRTNGDALNFTFSEIKPV